jgi:hypothetical protein
MRLFVALGTVATLSVLAPLAASVPPQRPTSATAAATPAAAEASARVVAAAQKFLATLDDAGRAKAQLPYETPVKATGWSNLPVAMVPRNGVRMGDLTPAQKTAALAVLAAAFSSDGYRKVLDIVRGDVVLRGNPGPGPGGPRPGGAPGGPPPGGPGGPGRVTFGEAEYYFAVFGTPSVTSPWMLQFGGHHLAVNMTMAGSRATLAPTLTGAQPATYTIEGKTIKPLGREVERAFALMASLDEGQRTQAIIGAQMADLVLGPGKDGRTIQPEGVKVATLSASQQAIVVDIVREWAGIANDAFAAPRMADIRARLPDTWFAWSGPTPAGSAAYFRIQGPTLVIEYAPQRSVEHIHTIYRDPTNDYGSSYAAK